MPTNPTLSQALSLLAEIRRICSKPDRGGGWADPCGVIVKMIDGSGVLEREEKKVNEQVRKEEGGGTARRVRSVKTSGSRALLKRACYRQGLAHALEAVERVLHNWEHNLEKKHELHGRPVVHERQEYMPLIRQSAEIARVRLTVIAEIQRMIDRSLEEERK